MPLLTVTKLYQDGNLLTEAHLDAIKNSLETFFNITQINDTNIQDEGISISKLSSGVAAEGTRLTVEGGSPVFKDDIEPGLIRNLGFAYADDALTITSSTGAALSATNRATIAVGGITSGRVTNLHQAVNVTLALNDAEWGLTADDSDVKLTVYAVNDIGHLKWGISLAVGLETISDTNSDTDSLNIDSLNKMLVNSGLSAGSHPVTPVGQIIADFTELTAIWDIQNVLVGPRVGVLSGSISTTEMADSAVTTTKINDKAVTPPKLWDRELTTDATASLGDVARSSTYSNTSGSTQDSSAAVLTCSGNRPVMITGVNGRIRLTFTPNPAPGSFVTLAIRRGTTQVAAFNVDGSNRDYIAGGIVCVDNPGSGTHSYTVRITHTPGIGETISSQFSSFQLVAYEI